MPRRNTLLSLVLALTGWLVVPAHAAAQRRIGFIAPKEGDVWVAGQTVPLRWWGMVMTNAPVRINLMQGRRSVLLVADRVPNRNGSYPWQIPNTVPAGIYTLQLTNPDSSVAGRSESFRIEAFGTLELRVTSPGEGDRWIRGESQNVIWRTIGSDSGPVTIRLIRRNSDSTAMVLGRGSNGGRFTWTVQMPPNGAGSYRIVVTPDTPNPLARSIPSKAFEIALTAHRIVAARVWDRWLGNEASVEVTYRFEGQRGCSDPYLQVLPEGEVADRNSPWEGNSVRLTRGRSTVVFNMRKLISGNLAAAPLRVRMLCDRDPTPMLDEQLNLPDLSWTLTDPAPIYIRNRSQFDVDRVWLIRRSGNRDDRQLAIRDLSVRRSGTIDYDDQRLIQTQYYHQRYREPDVSPYYRLEYEQATTLAASRYPVQRCGEFAPSVHYLRDYALVRETLFILDPNSTEPCRLEQVLRGPDARVYLYWPQGNPTLTEGDGHGPVSLEEMVNRGYSAYRNSEFDR